MGQGLRGMRLTLRNESEYENEDEDEHDGEEGEVPPEPGACRLAAQIVIDPDHRLVGDDVASESHSTALGLPC
jgi:hypothetical protein